MNEHDDKLAAIIAPISGDHFTSPLIDWTALGRERAVFDEHGRVDAVATAALDPLEKIAGPNPPSLSQPYRPSHKVREAVKAQLQSYIGIDVREGETATGSPMLTVLLPDGVKVNIVFTVARA